MIISVEVDVPTRSDRRISWLAGGVVAAVFAWMIAVALSGGDANPDPSPPPQQPNVALTADQATYLVYSSWLDSAAFSDCMNSRGFSREAVAGSEHGRVLEVAKYLGIVAMPPDSWIAPAEARNGYPATSYARSADLGQALQDVGDGGCQGPRTKVDVADAAAVTASVAAARADTTFYRYLAESMWLDENSPQALLYSTHRLIAVVDPEAPRASDKWLSSLEPIMEYINASEGWTEGPSEGYADFAQAVAVAPDGAMVVVRVGDPTVIERGFVSALNAPMIDCGGVGVLLGTAVGAASDTSPPVPYEALVEGACGAVE
jgi:hypothetical protein